MASLFSTIRSLWTASTAAIRGIDQQTLTDADATDDPYPLFDRWYRDAEGSGLYLPEAMALSTASPDGHPSSRQVLLKEWGPDEGFVFYTNYESRKARELDANPRASLLFHWNTLHRQIRIEGPVERVSREQSERYHSSRPRGSQIAAWSSEQSSVLESRTELEKRFREHEERFAGQEVPLPPFWGGYRVIPEAIEFWQGRANRMHDRLVYRRDDEGAWTVERLSP